MMKKLSLLILVSMYCSFMYSQLTPQQGKKDKYGFVNEAGEFVIKAEYDEVGNFSDGIAWVLKGGKYGYINETGKYVVKPKYSSVGAFNAFDLCKVSIGGSLNKKTGEFKGAKYGFIDRNAREIIKPKYAEVGAFNNDGVCWVNVGGKKDKKTKQLVGGKFGYLSVSGVELTKLEYSNVRRSFVNGFAWVAKGKKYGYIDIKGRPVTNVKYDAVQDTFHNDMAGVKLKSRYGYVSNKGRELPIKYIYTGDFEHGCALVCTYSAKEGSKYGYINMDGKEFIKPIYDNAHETFSEGRTAVSQNGKWAIFDVTGKQLTKFEYGAIKEYDNGLAAVSKTGGVYMGVPIGTIWGFVNLEGQVTTPFKYLYIGQTDESGFKLVGTVFSSGSGNKWTETMLEKEFNWIGQTSITQSTLLSSLKTNTANGNYNKDVANHMKRSALIYGSIGLSSWKKLMKADELAVKRASTNIPVSTHQAGFGWINNKGEEVIPLAYEKAMNFSEGLAAVKIKANDGFMWITSQNQIVLKTEYKSATSFSQGVAAVLNQELNQWGCINKSGNIVVPFALKDVEEAKDVVNSIYKISSQPVTPRQIKLFRLGKYRPQDKFKINTTIPNEMWDF